jgi:hypothetical protein
VLVATGAGSILGSWRGSDVGQQANLAAPAVTDPLLRDLRVAWLKPQPPDLGEGKPPATV